jgi:hypothetical protein
MAIDPFDWSVVVAGYWNPAILTPNGIKLRLFESDDETPLIVEVPIDGLLPHRVRHDGIIVVAESGRLVLTTETPTLANLEHAKNIAIRAIKNLPETPLTAAGFNIKIKTDEPTDKLLTATKAGMDNALIDAGFRIKTRNIRRSFEFDKGLLNFDVFHLDTTETKIEFNFHLQSSDVSELCEWLETPCDRIQDKCGTILEEVAGLQFEEAWK